MGQRLGQVIARLAGLRTKVKEAVTVLYKLVQKPALFIGYTRTYVPYSEDATVYGQQPENVRVQARYREVLAQAQKSWVELIDGTYTQDLANTLATADVEIDGKLLAKAVPATTLMFLIKQYTDVLTFAGQLPVPDPGIEWIHDSIQGLLKSKEPENVQKTQKVPKVLVHFEPTQHHPGKSEAYSVDEPVGRFTKIHYSGGCPQDTKTAIVERASRMVEALKVALDIANSKTDAPDQKLAGQLFDYIFEPLNSK